ncbi:hypothetical protein V6N13_120164 [Hibiscus sabdariffa]|uniref:Uncharacterized protein n=1 Tax=Hibiscus sabdariffa TaxID=183260 RepID=A0ABR2E705_9ROSI
MGFVMGRREREDVQVHVQTSLEIMLKNSVVNSSVFEKRAVKPRIQLTKRLFPIMIPKPSSSDTKDLHHNHATC